MYIQKIDLRNIACFDRISLDFTHPETNKPCPWVVLLGENGVGKSTILQMIALSLLGADMSRQIINDPDYWENFVRAAAVKGRVEVEVLTDTRDKKQPQSEQGCQKIYRSAVELGRTIKTRVKQDPDISDYEKLEDTLYSESLTNGWFASGYGAWRAITRLKSSASSRNILNKSSAKRYRFITLFDESSSLTQVSDWLVDLEFRRLTDRDNTSAQQSFNLAIHTLETVLEGLKFKTITPDSDVVFEENGVEVPIGHLSDGYRSVTAWVGDLVRRLVEAFPTLKKPLDVSGVVLVDEIDIHLHPTWQRKIVEDVRTIFPNLQFIVSSHSPFIAQDMRSEDKIIVLRREGEKIVSREDAGFVKGWRVDQILTSYLFDLETTRDNSIALKEQEYQLLLDLQATQGLSAEQRVRLDELKEWLQENRSAPGETLAENEVYDAAQTLIDLLDEYIK